MPSVARWSRVLIPVLLATLLGGCQTMMAASGTFAAVNVVTLAALGRSVPDVVVSYVRDRDCSVVRLEQGKSWCVPPDPVVAAPFCTHSLGMADCWARPALLPGHPMALADTPAATPAQIAHRAHHWPDAYEIMKGADPSIRHGTQP